MMLFYSGQSRFASTVAAEKIENLSKRHEQLHQMREFVDEGIKILQQPNRPLDDLGRLLHESWRLKKELASGSPRPRSTRSTRPAWPAAPWAASCWGRAAAGSSSVRAARMSRRDQEAAQGSDRGQRQDRQSRQRHRAVCAGSIVAWNVICSCRRNVSTAVEESS